MKRSPIRPVSAKRARANRKRTIVLAILKGQPCAVRWGSGCQGVGTTLHEPLLRSRGGDPTVAEGNVWTCGPCHEAIHANPFEATRRGLMRRREA